MLLLTIAVVAFVGSHFALSHPLRAPLVRLAGEGGFAILYSSVAFATLGWAVFEWRRAPTWQVWDAPDWAWIVAAGLMFIASVLFVGSVSAPNPSLMGAGGMAGAAGPRGVQRITRHPMMWAFAIWAVVHGGLAGDLRTEILCVGVIVLALVGAWLQDGKKRGQLGDGWYAHERATSFIPLGAQLRGRQRWATLYPGAIALIGGALLLAAATWAHPALMNAPQLGFWRMIG